jgi:hypothetical protein
MRSKIATNFKDVFEMAPEQNSREAGQKSVKHLSSGVFGAIVQFFGVPLLQLQTLQNRLSHEVIG